MKFLSKKLLFSLNFIFPMIFIFVMFLILNFDFFLGERPESLPEFLKIFTIGYMVSSSPFIYYAIGYKLNWIPFRSVEFNIFFVFVVAIILSIYVIVLSDSSSTAGLVYIFVPIYYFIIMIPFTIVARIIKFIYDLGEK